jgi:hypothetical protein
MTAVCLTFGERAENHVGMEKLGGELAENGYSLQDLEKVKSAFEELGNENVQLICLNDYLDTNENVEKAYVLHVKHADIYLGILGKQLMSKLEKLDWDKKYFDTRRGKVLNKNARHNLCFGFSSQEPDYENKKGRIVAYDDVNLLKRLRAKILEIVGEENLECEGNYYYDLKKTGIGFHGDTERKKVIGVNLSNPTTATREIHWKWFKNSKCVSDPVKLTLNHGDLYMMSEKATGFDWKKKKIYTLRHGAGEKYT